MHVHTEVVVVCLRESSMRGEAVAWSGFDTTFVVIFRATFAPVIARSCRPYLLTSLSRSSTSEVSPLSVRSSS